jgi:RES domain-containing protein
MTVYRLSLSIYARQMTGEGSKIYGGRWNEIGVPCIYACETRALCVLEYAANVDRDHMPIDLSFTIYELPDDAAKNFSINDLPDSWAHLPPTAATQAWGTAQLRDQLALRLPSVILPTEFNYVINHQHPDFKKVTIKAVEPFTFDPRIKH